MIDKRDALPTLAPGDYVRWPDGCHEVGGTIARVINITHVKGFRGNDVFTGITVEIDVPHAPTFDPCGWPKSTPALLTRTFRYPSDVYRAYTPTPTPAALPDRP